MTRAALARALLLAGTLIMPLLSHAEAIPVELRQTDDGWQLLRGGEP